MSDETNERLKRLFFKTPSKYVKTDPKGNSYITARYVMNVLDSIIGPADWSDDYRVIDTFHRPDGTARICVECKLTVCGVTKTDVGFGELEITEKTNKKTGEVYEVEFGNYEKEAYSIALKRAAVKFGIARDLYQDGMPRFEVEPDQPDSIPGEDDAPEEAPQAAATPPTRAAAQKQAPASGDTPETPENGAQGAPHWTEEQNWNVFWAYVKGDLLLDADDVHTALGVESVKDFAGEKVDAMKRLKDYALQKHTAEQEAGASDAEAARQDFEEWVEEQEPAA